MSRALLHGDSVESVQSASLRDFKLRLLSERLKAIHPAGDASHDVYTAASGNFKVVVIHILRSHVHDCDTLPKRKARAD